MKRHILWLFVVFSTIGAAALLVPALLAQDDKTDMEDVAKRLAKEVSRANLAAVAVADFQKSDGEITAEGHRLAQELAQEIGRNRHLQVSDPAQVKVMLTDAGLSPQDAQTAENLLRIQNVLHADAIVTGTIEIEKDRYVTRLTVRAFKDGSVVASEEQTVKRPSYTDMLLFLDPSGTVARAARPGERGVGVPTCIQCPIPQFPEKQTKGMSAAKIVLGIIIDEEGRVPRVALLSKSDPTMARTAMEAVKTWRFKPTMDKSGKPVAVIAPVEVTFNRY